MRTDKLNLAIKKVMGESSKKSFDEIIIPIQKQFYLV